MSGGGGGSSGADPMMMSSTENLLRNIQSLLKVAAENARQQDRQANYEKGELLVPTGEVMTIPDEPAGIIERKRRDSSHRRR